MAVNPIDFAALASNQRSDLSKVAADDFLKLQQQHISDAIRNEEEHKQHQTQQIEEKSGLMIEDEKQEQKRQRHNEEPRKESEARSEDSELKKEEKVEYVTYEDPDIGQVLDWHG